MWSTSPQNLQTRARYSKTREFSEQKAPQVFHTLCGNLQLLKQQYTFACDELPHLGYSDEYADHFCSYLEVCLIEYLTLNQKTGLNTKTLL